ncbi:DUF3953 domain-containing protein [Salinicoccus sp. HZC-1]|uniref:DUF3953 domain-containing protein n=1 Tax=Salinicoccus sp. HZC-1 TaxID=3385497 RepID=UPI00398ABFCC
MIFVLRLIFAVTTAGLAIYVLVTGNNELMSWMFLVMAFMFLVMAIDEFLNARHTFGVLSLVTFAFVLYVSLNGFILN